jgi:uncharacterized protein DUF6644
VISQFCKWLDATPVSQTFQSLVWFVPSVQTVHILSIAVVMTSVGMLAGKLAGITGRNQTLSAMVSSIMPWVWCALAVLLATGLLLTITEPSRELLNAAFRAKMLMVLAMAGILRLVQVRLRQDPDYWGRRRAAAGGLGAASLLLAVTIIVAGRWIAYI